MRSSTRCAAKGAVTPPTVYRSLDKLIEKGLAHRLESLNAYVACKHPHHDHDMAAFAICESCGLVKEFTDPHISERLSHWSDDHAFSAKKVTVEIRGLCDSLHESRRAAGTSSSTIRYYVDNCTGLALLRYVMPLPLRKMHNSEHTFATIAHCQSRILPI